jgi:hypothetical protein
MSKVETKEKLLGRVQTAAFNMRKVNDDMDMSDLTVEELSEVEDKALSLRDTAVEVATKAFMQSWERPEKWATVLRHDGQLYDAQPVLDLLEACCKMQTFGGPCSPWVGYQFRVKGEYFAFRRFVRGGESVHCDIVPSKDECAKETHGERNIFWQREDIERMAKEHGLTVFEFLTNQTSEPLQNVVALYFI